MNRKRFASVGGSGLLALMLLAGCQSAQPSAATFAVRQVPHDPSTTSRAAEDALSDLGYTLDRQDVATLTLRSAPREIRSRAGGAGSRGLLSTPARLREVVDMRLEGAGDGTRVYCRVLMQEQATEVYRLREPDMHGSDSPAATAIDRDAGTTREQNTVWKTVRRDGQQERRILQAVLDHVGGTESTPADSNVTPIAPQDEDVAPMTSPQ